MDFNHTSSFEDMQFDLSGRSLFLRNHSMPIIIPSLNSLGFEGVDPNEKADFSVYIRCQDKNGNSNVNEFSVNYCIKKGEDLTPPSVTARSPPREEIAFDKINVNASVFLNEPAECKW